MEIPVGSIADNLFPVPDIVEDGGEMVHVAVGKSVEKGVGLVKWSLKRFGNCEICIVHIHQPSQMIPTLLGKLPVGQANGEVVSAYRIAERERTMKLLINYLSIFNAAKVKARTITTESDQVEKGIVDLVNRHGIKRLVMSVAPDNCMKVMRSSIKSNYVSKNIPQFCEIWFINKGNVMWMKEASEDPIPITPIFLAASNTSPLSLRWRKVSSNSDNNMEDESTYSQLLQARIEIETSKIEALSNQLERRGLESEGIEFIGKVRTLECSHAHEVELRKEADGALRSTLQQQEKLIEERENLNAELEKVTRNVALMDSCAQEVKSRCDELSGELKLTQTSIGNLRHEKKKLRREKKEALLLIEGRRNQGPPAGTSNFKLVDFSLSDIRNATCNFSECFKIGQGGYGYVYKGEILDKTVAIKKLHPHDMHGQSEFQQEVSILGKLRHPHLVTLLGACPEAWSLVYDYVPNGSLQNRLFHKYNTSPLSWKIRAQFIGQLIGALFLLHKEKIIHGNLQLTKILVDSDLSCKIYGFGFSRLLPGNALRCSSFRYYSKPTSGFPYTDPEFHRTGVLTLKSDVYSFGIIVLQLVTGRPPIGLAGDVRKTVASGNFASILDSSCGDWPTFVAKRLVDIGLQCCEANNRDRPELTSTLVRELEQLHVLEERPVPSFFLCPILKEDALNVINIIMGWFQEIMHDPQVAADGFSYEGEALRSWLENGRKTSPMTNLEFSHLHLTPNQALRLAIQHWICNY